MKITIVHMPGKRHLFTTREKGTDFLLPHVLATNEGINEGTNEGTNEGSRLGQFRENKCNEVRYIGIRGGVATIEEVEVTS